jgi:hypothetical protein
MASVDIVQVPNHLSRRASLDHEAGPSPLNDHPQITQISQIGSMKSAKSA